MLEIALVTAPSTLFVWNKNRVAPVRITEVQMINEEAFDLGLNLIRARSASASASSVYDLGLRYQGNIFMVL